jgi:hypothetical protein
MLAAATGGLLGVLAFSMAIDYPVRVLPAASERALPVLLSSALGVGTTLTAFGLLLWFHVNDQHVP